MREAAFIRQNKTKWNQYQSEVSTDPDVLAEDIIENLEAGLESFRTILAALEK